MTDIETVKNAQRLSHIIDAIDRVERSLDGVSRDEFYSNGDDTKPFSTDNVGITLAEPKDGKIKFTAGPTDTTATSFFMKVKMK